MWWSLAFAEPSSLPARSPQTSLPARVAVADLDPDVLPEAVGFDDRGRLVVDGQVVRGTDRAKLEWLARVVGDDELLELEARRAGLRERNLGRGIGIGAGAVGIVGAIVAPPVAIPLLVVGAAGSWTGFGITRHGADRYAERELRDDLQLGILLAETR